MKPAGWVALLVIVGALAFGARAFVTNLTPYVSFEAARKSQGTVQVMGALDKESVRTSPKELSFVIIEKNTGERMPVTFTSAPPPNFKMAIEVTPIGKFDGQVFRADNLLVKCPTKYQGTESGTETKSYAAQ